MIDLYNGDCLEIMDKLIEKNINVDSIITDIPYGTTNCSWDSIIPFDEMWMRLNKLIKPNGAIILFGVEPFSSKLRVSNINNFRYDWIWEKNSSSNFFNMNKQPAKNTEDIIVFYNKPPIYNPQYEYGVGYKPIKGKIKGEQQNYYAKEKTNKGNDGSKYLPKCIIKDIKILQRNKLHPTQKPIKLMEYLIKTYTNENETVLDFTMGSGSTLVACKQLNRKGIGIELDKDYFEIAQNRVNEAIKGFSLEIEELIETDNLDEF